MIVVSYLMRRFRGDLELPTHCNQANINQVGTRSAEQTKGTIMSKTTINELEVNGQTYILKDGVTKAVDTDHVIVIAQRGWIFEGYKDKDVEDKLQLLNANVVRSWSNGKGIGGLCNKSNKSDYTLLFHLKVL